MLFYKTSFLNHAYIALDFLKPSFIKQDGLKKFPEPLNERRGITSTKRYKIISVLRGVPQAEISFWINIPCNETSLNLCSEREKGNPTSEMAFNIDDNITIK